MPTQPGKEIAGRNVKPANTRASKLDVGYHPAQAITENQILYVSGIANSSTGAWAMDLADADAEATANGPLFIACTDASVDSARAGDSIARANPGPYLVGPVDTSGGSAGDTVFLSTTAGGWTLTAPSANPDVVRPIGRVLTSATLGYWVFDGHAGGDYTIVPA